MIFRLLRTAPIAAIFVAASWLHAAPERPLSAFADLEKRSPFSLPTAEEKSPLSERYALTGAASWDGQQRVFLLDKTTQERHVVLAGPGPQAMELMEFLPSADPREMRARVRIGQEIATLDFETPDPATTAADAAKAALLQRGQPGAPGSAVNPAQPTATVANPQTPTTQPPRRIIRRRVINPAPTTP